MQSCLITTSDDIIHVYQGAVGQVTVDQLVANDRDFLLHQFLPFLIFSYAFLQMRV